MSSRDCLILGHYAPSFPGYVEMVRAMGPSNGAYRDLRLAFLEYEGVPPTSHFMTRRKSDEPAFHCSTVLLDFGRPVRGPVLLGRSNKGELFALRDICPHRAAPLSAGRFHQEASGATTVECPYHGWRFGADGSCAAIPSLVDDQAMDVSRIRVRRYPIAESQGLIFVWIASDARGLAEPTEPPPVFEGVVGGAPKLVDRMDFELENKPHLKLLSVAPSEIVRRQVYFTSCVSARSRNANDELRAEPI